MNANEIPARRAEYVLSDADKRLYKFLWWLGVIIICSLSILTVVGFKWNIHLVKYFDLGPSCLVLLILVLLGSFRAQSLNEFGIAFYYGRPVQELSSGLHFVPVLLLSFVRLSQETQEFQCPDEPEKVFKGHDWEPLPEGMVRPIRITTGSPETKRPRSKRKAAGGVLDVQSTFIASFIFRWQIKRPLQALKVLRNSQKAIEKEVKKQLRDIGEAVVAEDASKGTMEDLLARLPKINKALLTEANNRFGDTGVWIESALLISPDLGQTTAESLATVPAARATAKNTRIMAKANKEKFTEEGKGHANAVRAELEARAKGSKAMAEALEIKGHEVLAFEAVRSISEKTDVILAGGEDGTRDILKLVKGAQSALKPTETEGGTTS